MSKAEKFIEEHTNTTYNYNSYAQDPIPWLTPDQARKAVEIARKELIEKVCSFIDDNIDEYIDVRGYTGDAFIDVECDKFINDLKQAMNYE